MLGGDSLGWGGCSPSQAPRTNPLWEHEQQGMINMWEQARPQGTTDIPMDTPIGHRNVNIRSGLLKCGHLRNRIPASGPL